MTAYRGWSVTFEYGHYWGTGPNYDASWEGEEDGWVDNGERVSARGLGDLHDEIDEHIAAQGMEARKGGDGETRLHAEHDSPVRKDAPTPHRGDTNAS